MYQGARRLAQNLETTASRGRASTATAVLMQCTHGCALGSSVWSATRQALSPPPIYTTLSPAPCLCNASGMLETHMSAELRHICMCVHSGQRMGPQDACAPQNRCVVSSPSIRTVSNSAPCLACQKLHCWVSTSAVITHEGGVWRAVDAPSAQLNTYTNKQV